MNILITGSNRGIGLNFCKHYKNRGDTVYAVCRQSSAELDSLGVKVISGIEVTDNSSLAELAAQIDDNSLDIVINNAGILRDEVFGKLNIETIEQQFQTNALAPLKLSEALHHKLKNPSKLVFITSRMGSITDNTSGGRYGYRMSKAALNIAAKSLSIDLAPQSISVAILHPGYVQTDMVGNRGDISAFDAAARLIDRIDELTLNNSGDFLHGSGENLPW